MGHGGRNDPFLRAPTEQPLSAKTALGLFHTLKVSPTFGYAGSIRKLEIGLSSRPIGAWYVAFGPAPPKQLRLLGLRRFGVELFEIERCDFALWLILA
jgi:hypothetical protein